TAQWSSSPTPAPSISGNDPLHVWFLTCCEHMGCLHYSIVGSLTLYVNPATGGPGARYMECDQIFSLWVLWAEMDKAEVVASFVTEDEVLSSATPPPSSYKRCRLATPSGSALLDLVSELHHENAELWAQLAELTRQLS